MYVFSEEIDRQEYAQVRYHELIGASPKALKIIFAKREEPLWVALSLTDFEFETEPPFTIFIRKWLVKKLGLRLTRPRHLVKV